MSGCVEWVMTPSFPVTLIEPMPVKSRARRGERRQPFAVGRGRAPDAAAVDNQLAQRRIAGGKRLAQILGQDEGEIAGAQLGGVERLRPPPPDVAEPQRAHEKERSGGQRGDDVFGHRVCATRACQSS